MCLALKVVKKTLEVARVKCPHRKLWHVRVPLKVEVLLWLVNHNNTLTKETLLHWVGKVKIVKFMSYDAAEFVEHLFFECVFYLINTLECD
jgi:hypothetical protein